LLLLLQLLGVLVVAGVWTACAGDDDSDGDISDTPSNTCVEDSDCRGRGVCVESTCGMPQEIVRQMPFTVDLPGCESRDVVVDGDVVPEVDGTLALHLAVGEVKMIHVVCAETARPWVTVVSYGIQGIAAIGGRLVVDARTTAVAHLTLLPPFTIEREELWRVAAEAMWNAPELSPVAEWLVSHATDGSSDTAREYALLLADVSADVAAQVDDAISAAQQQNSYALGTTRQAVGSNYDYRIFDTWGFQGIWGELKGEPIVKGSALELSFANFGKNGTALPLGPASVNMSLSSLDALVLFGEVDLERFRGSLPLEVDIYWPLKAETKALFQAKSSVPYEELDFVNTFKKAFTKALTNVMLGGGLSSKYGMPNRVEAPLTKPGVYSVRVITGARPVY